MSNRGTIGSQSSAFNDAMRDLRAARLRPEVRVTEVPAPSRIAPYAVALTAEVITSAADWGHAEGGEDELASGRFVLLHDPSCPEPWAGEWRAVTFARAELEPEVATDPMLGDVGWAWLIDALDSHGVGYTAEAGTVTRVVSQSYAGLADRAPTVEMEVRASWTPVGANLADHLIAWTDVLCTIAGLPPLPEGVIPLPGQRR